jgi:murein DD-endopeptidase MepM/ murein hydrolase activator NlpD
MNYRGAEDIAPVDLTAANREVASIDPKDTAALSAYFVRALAASGKKFLAGGYGEDRVFYQRSPAFTEAGEPRTIHLGIDIWGPAGEPVFAPLASLVHSFQDNAAFGDYGPTIVLAHELEGEVLYSLYGHLSRESLDGLHPGKRIAAGERIAWLGAEDVNGGWPPHLHFQVIRDLGGARGDYPGVAARSRSAAMLANCPDPNLLLRIL